MKTPRHISVLLGGSVVFSAGIAAANPGDISKFAQYPQPNMGYNRASDMDWRLSTTPDPAIPPVLPGWVVADDFPNLQPEQAINTVRWWGSYFAPAFEPQPDPVGGWRPVVEDGWTVSFFRDIPAGPIGGFSRPGPLLATYIAGVDAVSYAPTNQVGWDQHRVWEYRLNLKEACLDHYDPLFVDSHGQFIQRGFEDVYWISIAAENGATIVVGPDGGWQAIHNQDQPITSHFWGWHTSPENFLDLPTDSPLIMAMLPGTTETEWIYGPWQPIQPDHMGVGQAFELFVPSPAAIVLFIGAGSLVAVRRRR